MNVCLCDDAEKTAPFFTLPLPLLSYLDRAQLAPAVRLLPLTKVMVESEYTAPFGNGAEAKQASC